MSFVRALSKKLTVCLLLSALLCTGFAGPSPALAATTPTPRPPAPRNPTPTPAPTLAPTRIVPRTPVAPNISSPTDPLAAAGLKIYLKNYCGVCHALPAAGTRGTFGPPHDHIATTAAARIAEPGYRGPSTTAAAYLRESIVDPKAYAAAGYANTPHPMPTYAHLPAADIDALVYFLLQQE